MYSWRYPWICCKHVFVSQVTKPFRGALRNTAQNNNKTDTVINIYIYIYIHIYLYIYIYIICIHTYEQMRGCRFSSFFGYGSRVYSSQTLPKSAGKCFLEENIVLGIAFFNCISQLWHHNLSTFSVMFHNFLGKIPKVCHLKNMYSLKQNQ